MSAIHDMESLDWVSGDRQITVRGKSMISLELEVVGDVQVAGSKNEDEYSLMVAVDEDILTLKGTENDLRALLRRCSRSAGLTGPDSPARSSGT